MNTCKKCGAILIEGSKFCGQCGSVLNDSLKNICPKCKNEVDNGMIFCNACGEKLRPSTINNSGVSSKIKILIITREMQFQCATNTYKAIVNGNLIGSVGIGKSITANVDSEIVTLDIICTTITVNAKLRLVLKLGNNPKVSFKVQWPGAIIATVYDADIIEQKII